MVSELTATERVTLLEQMQAQDVNRRRKTVAAAWGSVGIATLVLAFLAVGAWWLVDNAQNELKRIKNDYALAEAKLRTIGEETKNMENRLAAVNTELSKKSAQLMAATQTLGIAAQAQGKDAFEKQLGADPKVAQLLPRAYLQIVDPQDREWATAILRRLEESGIIVPGIELVPKAAGLKRTDVRYYKKSELEGAKRIVELLKAAGVSAALNYLNQENNPNVRPNQFEVWFAAGSRNTK